MKAIILAGGKGTRLKPYTTNFPKPLMPVGDKPILEILMNQLSSEGIKDIYIATGHLSELIRIFFGNGSKFGVNITYSIEDKPLGTAGPLNNFKNLISDDFVVINGDTLTDLKYADMLSFHKKNENVATIATIERKNYIDFGIISLDSNSQYKDWTEKPTMKYLVSMGVYIFNPQVFEFIKDSVYFDLPELIKLLYKNKKKIMGYKHDGYWLDIGRPSDYSEACDKFWGEN